MSLWLFLPLVVVVGLAASRSRRSHRSSWAPSPAALLAAIVDPGRVIAFADPGEELPRVVALLKGVWLALASGYKSSSGVASLDLLASRGGMDSMLEHDLAHHHGARLRRRRREGRRPRSADHADHRTGEVGRRPRRLARLVDHRHQRHHGRPVHRDRAAGPDVQVGLCAARPGAGRVVPFRRGFGHAHVGAHPLEQLRRLHGGDAGRGHRGATRPGPSSATSAR